LVGANFGAPFGGSESSDTGSFAGSYRSQYFFGATNGRCGLANPTARKNGLPFNSRSNSQPRLAIQPSFR
jgi:hypothetical protein